MRPLIGPAPTTNAANRIGLLNLRTGVVKTLVPPGRRAISPTVSPDGRYVVYLLEYSHSYRVIPTTAGSHVPSAVTLWQGDSRGRWDGDTLVVDVTGFNEETWFDRSGNFHSDALHVVERYTRVAPDALNYEATIDDSKVFTRPWKISMPLYRRLEKNAQLMDFKCVEFVEELLYGQWRKKPLTK